MACRQKEAVFEAKSFDLSSVFAPSPDYPSWPFMILCKRFFVNTKDRYHIICAEIASERGEEGTCTALDGLFVIVKYWSALDQVPVAQGQTRQ